MPQQEIVIDIDEHGNVTIEGKNFQGPECKVFTKAIEEALGTVTSTVNKPEYHRTKPKLRTGSH